MDLSIRKAKISEIDIAFGLLKKAAEWLKEKQIDYWQDWLNPPVIYSDWIKQGFENEEFYFAYENLQIIGMFRLQWSDEMFWGNQEEDSGYIHSLTVDRRYYGHRIGIKVIDMIEEICRKNNKKYLRLDCGITIKKLCDYYKSQGFITKGEIELLGEKLMLLEKRL
jgi:GNAT superfamily N-acetyltransferase